MAPHSRPSLGARAVSDMAPLVSPSPDASRNEIGRGTHVMQGAVRISSGKRMLLGGVAPISPFLPLPPAPTAAELRRQCRCENGNDGDVDDHASDVSLNECAGESGQDHAMDLLAIPDLCQRRNSSNDVCHPASRPSAVPKRLAPPEPAPFMIRSYSMPVATQRDYDAQRRNARRTGQQQRPFQQAYTPAWSMSRTNSNSSDLASADPPARSPLGTLTPAEMNSSTLARTMSRGVTLHAVQNGDMAATSTVVPTKLIRWDAKQTDNGSAADSDEADVSTPRAVSPVIQADKCDTAYFSIHAKEQPGHAMALDEFQIHPDHLQPPPAWTA